MARGFSRHMLAFFLLFQGPSAITLEASTGTATRLHETETWGNRPLPGVPLHHGGITAVFELVQLLLVTGEPFGILATKGPDHQAAEHG